MNTILAAQPTASQSTASQATGLVQIETLSTLEMLTGIPAVEWLECPAESPERRAARLERIADTMLALDDSTARRVAALHREVLAEPAFIEIERVDRVFGPVVTRVLVDEMAPYAELAASPGATVSAGIRDAVTALTGTLAGVRAA